ncbi:MAG TPA: TAXI family TRAP transporter solute-binding subunit [Vicinamibacterales bacterium]|nr:TAXI family TRAP transporter solute-binding subunit [Vicinamibacterales bacterium]
MTVRNLAAAAGAALCALGMIAVGSNPREFARAHGGVVRLSIATGNTGGVYYPYGGGLAKVIGESLRVQATAEVTAASVDNLKLIQQRKVDIAFTLADTLDDAIAGRGAFARTGPIEARTLAVLYPNYTHLATVAGNGVDRIPDLRGRVVSTGSPGSGTEVIALRVLRAAGVDPDRDVRRQALSVNASVDALKDGKIDAFFWSGGLPTASILDLASSVGIRARLIPNDEVIPALQRQFGDALYTRRVIPKGSYPGMTSEVGVVAVQNALVVHGKMEEPLAYDLTRVLFERRAALTAIHPEARHLSLPSAVEGSPAPFHPGAERFYRERGAWKQ